MTSELRTIRLYGILGKTFGRVYRLAVATPKEAVKALSVMIPGFEVFINNSRQRGLTYAVFSGKRNIGAQELDMDNSAEDIRIAPVIIGSKRGGLFQTILGVALIGAAVWMPGVGIAASNLMFAAGATMTLGGVAQLLSPQTRGLASKQDADNRASYAFGSVTNTTAQGYPVALAYGKPRIGGAIISAGIYVEDQQ
ncbi:tail assembly protein [Pantoea coffeiphila]|uniref:Phage tail protein n=1 Tax=Pantoea coffeiphila TaxID=1465635 RepID=A0A2S9I847_9GAMM|nr:tail assembly protein [Pantoea coffeiphila]PRD13968.1 phage tail protein [Pantoea coffeiphila]